MRNEDPPNKEVHASDLADALAKLGTTAGQSGSDHQSSSDPLSPVSVSSSSSDINNNNSSSSNNNNDSKEVTPGVGRTGSWPSGGRSRSSTLIYHPNNHGGSPNLPAVMVEDTSIGEDDDDDAMSLSSSDGEKRIFAHTSRPPVELME